MNKTKILAVTSGKGGVGKTTVSLNIARQLSLSGLRTLIIDFDVHNKGATCLFMDQVARASVQSITHLVRESESFKLGRAHQLAEQTSLLDLKYQNTLYLMPAALPDEMIQWERMVCANDAIVTFFRAFIIDVSERYNLDVVLIDCYGGVDTLTVAAAGTADDLIIINEPDVITFAGTLLLYKHLQATYCNSERVPRIHFIINRISARHSFRFLQQEYKEHLSELAVDRGVLAYLPFDKLVFDTFGNYPFFSELLPKGLYTAKIRELIARLWPDPRFEQITVPSPQKRQRIYAATAESPFADPERILQAWKTAPAWALLPIIAMIILYLGPRQTIGFFTLRVSFYMSLVLVATVIFWAVLFEPWQVSRWLLRKAGYERRRRALHQLHAERRRGADRVVSSARGAWNFLLSCAPAVIGLVCFLFIAWLAYGMDLLYPFKNVSIWHNQINGFTHDGDYRGMILGDNAIISPNSDLSGALLQESKLQNGFFPRTNLVKAHFDDTDTRLDGSKFVGSNLDQAFFERAILTKADLSASSAVGARFNRIGGQQAIFWGANLKDADFSGAMLYQGDFRQCNLNKANFNGATIKDTLFDGADLTGADFSKADFQFIDEDRQAELFSQLQHQGAQLTKEQEKIAKLWEESPARVFEQLALLERLAGQATDDRLALEEASIKIRETRPWWLDWDKSRPAHLNDSINPRIRLLAMRLDWKNPDQTGRRNIAGRVPTSNELQKVLKNTNDLKGFATKTDLIELLLVRGQDNDFVLVADALNGMLLPKKDLSLTTDDWRNQGVTLLLKTLRSIIVQDDPKEASNVEAWAVYLQGTQDHQLAGWSWNMWNSNFPARRYPREVVIKVRAIELAALGELSPAQMRQWFSAQQPTVPASTAHR